MTGTSEWYHWHDTHAILLVQVDWHRLYWYQKTGQCVWPFREKCGQSAQCKLYKTKLKSVGVQLEAYMSILRGQM